MGRNRCKQLPFSERKLVHLRASMLVCMPATSLAQVITLVSAELIKVDQTIQERYEEHAARTRATFINVRAVLNSVRLQSGHHR